MQRHDYDLIVVGGGIVGLSTALSLAAFGLKLALIDNNSLDTNAIIPNGRVYAINQTSRRLWENLDVWPLFEPEDLAPYQKMHIWDASNHAHIDFDSRLVSGSELGFIMSDTAIKKALLQKIQQSHNIDIFQQQTVETVCSNESRVCITNKQNSWEANTLLIADGAESPLRNKLQVPLTSWFYHHHAITATVTIEKPHKQTAWQVFNPDGPLAFLPLKNPNQCSIVWSTSPKRAQHLKEVDDLFFNQALNESFGHTLGKISIAGSRHTFPLVMRQAKQYAGQNWALLGDAAHTIHPLAGLGLNMGLADVSLIVSLIQTGKKPHFTKKMLGAYQRERKSAVWQAIALVSAIKTLFGNPMPPIHLARGLGLRLCNQLTPLKRLFIEYANGQSDY